MEERQRSLINLRGIEEGFRNFSIFRVKGLGEGSLFCRGFSTDLLNKLGSSILIN